MLFNRYNPEYIQLPTIHPEYLPRNVRATVKGSSSSPAVLERLEKLFSPRTLRLLRNLDELEREVNDSSPPHGSRVSVLQEETDKVEDKLSDEKMQWTLELARKVQPNVPRNNLTKYFHQACDTADWAEPYRGWKYYKECCRNRLILGEYFRSELDWNWNLAKSLKRMYKLPREWAGLKSGLLQCGNPQRSDAYAGQEATPTQPIGSLTNGLLVAVVDRPVDEVRITVRSPTGQTAYTTFIAVSSSTYGVSQDGAGTRPVVRVHGATDLYPSTGTDDIFVSIAPDFNSHQHDDHDHQQELLKVKSPTSDINGEETSQYC